MTTENPGTPAPETLLAAGTPQQQQPPAASASSADGSSKPVEGAKPATLAEGNEPGTPAAPQTFPDDWRAKLAGDDKKELARLERFSSPKDVWDAYRAAEAKISSGQTKVNTALPANATDEQKAEYRKANNIPDSPEKYDIALDKGIVIGEADKPVVDNYLKYAHENNIPQNLVKGQLQWYMEQQAANIVAKQELDNEFKTESIVKLREEWGPEYKANVNRIKGLTDMFPQEDIQALLGGYTSDGRIIGNDPRILHILDRLAREVDPAGAVVPGSNNVPAAIASEMATLKGLMGDTRSEYWNGLKAVGHQARYRDLLEADEKINRKKA